MKQKKRVEIGDLIAICRPEYVCYCRVENIEKNHHPMGLSTDYIAIDTVQEMEKEVR